jgi:hypothetical protein
MHFLSLTVMLRSESPSTDHCTLASRAPPSHIVARSLPRGFAQTVAHPASIVPICHAARSCYTESVCCKHMCSVLDVLDECRKCFIWTKVDLNIIYIANL